MSQPRTGEVASPADEPRPAPDPVIPAAPTPRPPRSARREWGLTFAVTGGVLLVLGVLTYNPDRAAVEGIVAGVAWGNLLQIALTVMLFALFALGLNLEYGHTGLLNFGHVAFLGVGAYTGAILTAHFGGWMDDGPGWAVLGIALIVAASVAAAVLLAVAVGLPTLRLREDYLAITTIGAAEILRITWLNWRAVTNGPDGLVTIMPGGGTLRGDGPWASAFTWLDDTTGIGLDPYRTFLLLVATAVFLGAYWVLRRLADSPWGRITGAIREDELIAAALGKNVFLIKIQSLAIGSVIAALAGVLYSWSVGHITPATFVPIVTFYAWIIVIVGGAGNHRAVLVGSVLLWGLFESARNLDFLRSVGITQTSGPLQILIIGVTIVLVMRFAPHGVMGRDADG